jgi:hypothetical protein
MLATETLRHPWILLILGVGLLFSAGRGLVTGRASVFVPGGFERSEQPFQYWTAVVSLIVGGVIGIVLFFVQALS